MSQPASPRESISIVAIARAVVAGFLPGLQVVGHRPELRQKPAGYQLQALRQGLGCQFVLMLASGAGEGPGLLEVSGISGLFEVAPLSAAEQAQQQTAEKTALDDAPFQLGIGERRFPVTDVQQAVEWAIFLIGYIPRYAQGFFMDPEFLSRDYAEIARVMERDHICSLHGVKGVAYLLPGTGQPTYALYYPLNAAPPEADPDALLALVAASSPQEAEHAGRAFGQVVATLFDE